MPYKDYPESAVNNAKRALKHKNENGSDCGTAVGWRRANQIANREVLSVETIKRTYSFLERAKVYDQGKYFDDDGNEICGSVMYDAWGGDSMRTWAKKKIDNLPENERELNMEKEIRSGKLELRAMNDEKRTISGYAAMYEQMSDDLGGFTEVIDREAFAYTDMDDVRALFNHDSNQILGRTKSGTLRLKLTEVGLYYEVDLPETERGKEMYELIKRGDVDQSSFAFTVEEDDWMMNEGRMFRTIKKIDRLFDVAPVTYPAYQQTSVMARSIDKLKNNQDNPTPKTDAIARERELTLINLK